MPREHLAHPRDRFAASRTYPCRIERDPGGPQRVIRAEVGRVGVGEQHPRAGMPAAKPARTRRVVREQEVLDRMLAADPLAVTMRGDPFVDPGFVGRPTRTPLGAGQDLGGNRGGHDIQRIDHAAGRPERRGDVMRTP